MGKKVTLLRTMTISKVTVSFLSDDTAPDEYGGTFLLTLSDGSSYLSYHE